MTIDSATSPPSLQISLSYLADCLLMYTVYFWKLAAKVRICLPFGLFFVFFKISYKMFDWFVLSFDFVVLHTVIK